MELSARTVLSAGLDVPDGYNEYDCGADPFEEYQLTRCGCDFYFEHVMTELRRGHYYDTDQYIDVLPLPTTVKAGLVLGQSIEDRQCCILQTYVFQFIAQFIH